MIFVTVGTQLPFPRLIDYMATWATSYTERVVFQTGMTCNQSGLEAYESLSSEQYNAHLGEARIVVSHAGIGSILAAKSAEKPIILVPRRASLREHRNDHQVATALAFEDRRGLRVAWEVEHISTLLDQSIEAAVTEQNSHYDGLVDRIRSFVSA